MSGWLGEVAALARACVSLLRDEAELLASVREHIEHPDRVAQDVRDRVAQRRLARAHRAYLRAQGAASSTTSRSQGAAK